MTADPPGTGWVPYAFGVVVYCLVILGIVGALGRERTSAPMSRETYFVRWTAGHGDIEPRGLVAWWLRRVYVCGRPLAAAGVSPTVLTCFGLVLAGAVPCVAAVGPRWAIVAGVVVAASAGFDSLDGAVAVLSSRTSAWGSVLDSLVDRVSDWFFLVAFWVLGVSAWLCIVAGVGLSLLEYARARAGAVGMTDVGVVTVGERPTRVIIASSFLITAGIFCGRAEWVAAVGVLLTAVVAFVGLTQLLIVVRRTLLDH